MRTLGLVVLTLVAATNIACNPTGGGSVSGKAKDTETQYGPKMQAFEAVVEQYGRSPGDYASGAEREAYMRTLQEVQNRFSNITFDPKQNRKEAQAIIELYRQKLEGRYSGQLFLELDADIREMYGKLTD